MTVSSLASASPLSALLRGLEVRVRIPTVAVHGLSLDSRTVAPGDVFFALAGERRHGLDYFDAVVAVGAAAILVDAADPRCDSALRARAARAGVSVLPVAALDRHLGTISSRFFGRPSHAMTLIGVTATDGKTSISQFIAQALHRPGAPCGVIGTLGSGVPGAMTDSGMTTPDAVSLQRTLADFRARNVARVAMEVSSHALSQNRVSGVEFDIAVLANLGRDHIDYHHSLDAYHASKLRLLCCAGVHTAVLNIDDPEICRHLAQLEADRPAAQTLIRYATDPARRVSADVFAEDIVLTDEGIQLTIVAARNRLRLRSPLIGDFNVGNLLATFVVLRALGLAESEIVARLSVLHAVPGRAECFTAPRRATAVVDYAHTPQALEAILRSLRVHCSGALWCVFGCGGDRDRGKRARMGRVAECCADRVIVTDDNPRSEPGDRIVNDILNGLTRPKMALVERDRAAAIRYATSRAGPDDWVLIAGKGHERYQVVGDRRIPCSDRDTVAALLAESAND